MRKGQLLHRFGQLAQTLKRKVQWPHRFRHLLLLALNRN